MEAYSRLQPTNEARSTFTDYFEAGHSNASAMRECERNLHVPPSSIKNANAQVNPTYRTVRYWHTQWLAEKFGAGAKGEANVLRVKKNIYSMYKVLHISLPEFMDVHCSHVSSLCSILCLHAFHCRWDEHVPSCVRK